jgi:hypothetical protein
MRPCPLRKQGPSRGTGLRWILDGSVQLAKQLGKVAVARLRRRSLEAAESGGDSRVAGRHIDSDDPAIHRIEVRYRNSFSLQFHADLQTTQSAGKFRANVDTSCEKPR